MIFRFFVATGRIDRALGVLYRVSRLPLLCAAATIMSVCVLHVALVFTTFYVDLWGDAMTYVMALFQLSSLGIYVVVYVHSNFALCAKEVRARRRRVAWIALDGVPLVLMFVALLFGGLASPIALAGMIGFILTGSFAVWFRLVRRLRLGYEEAPPLPAAVALGD